MILLLVCYIVVFPCGFKPFDGQPQGLSLRYEHSAHLIRADDIRPYAGIVDMLVIMGDETSPLLN